MITKKKDGQYVIVNQQPESSSTGDPQFYYHNNNNNKIENPSPPSLTCLYFRISSFFSGSCRTANNTQQPPDQYKVNEPPDTNPFDTNPYKPTTQSL